MMRGIRLIVVLVIMACIVAPLTLFGMAVYRARVYSGNVNRIRRAIHNMESRRPDHVEPQVWEATINWLSAASINICASREHAPLESVQRLAARFESRTSTDVNLDTAEWMWDEFAGASSHGSRYVRCWRACYLEKVAQNQPELLSDSMKDHLRTMHAMEKTSDR